MVYIVRLRRMDSLKATAILVNLCFAYWSFCYIFFYGAPDAETAWFWHRISSFGWISFCAIAVHFFHILSKEGRARLSWRLLVVLYGVPVILLADALFGASTPVAKGVIRSTSGSGWTYVSNYDSPWFWSYIAYIVVFFTVGLGRAKRWARESPNPRHRHQVAAIVWLDIVVIAIASVSDLVAPYLGLGWQPVATLLVDGWMVGFIYIIRKYKLMHIYEAASPDLILATIIDPVLLLDRDGVVQACNEGCAALFKAPVDMIKGQPLSRFFASGRYSPENLEHLFEKKRIDHLELDLVDAEGRPMSVLGSFSVAETKLDGVIGIVANLHDIGELKRTQRVLSEKEADARRLADELYRIAHYDSLTGLPNRRLFFQRLGEAIATKGAADSSLLVAYTDLDGFKAVNDRWGHEIGDKLLGRVAAWLGGVLEAADTVARVGGDEFVVLLHGARARLDDSAIVRLLTGPFEEPVVIDGHPCSVGLSVGVARFPADGADIDALLRIADQRMYTSKKTRKGDQPPKPHFHSSE